MNNRRKLLLALSGLSATTVWTKPIVNAVTLPVHAQTSPTGTTFLFTGGEQTYVVPNGVTSINVSAYGAQGVVRN